jgi:hypothetical protein
MVAVRETVPRRAVSYREVVNSKLLTITISDWPSRGDKINGHNVLKSSGTSPNFLITLVIAEIARGRVTRAAERDPYGRSLTSCPVFLEMQC